MPTLSRTYPHADLTTEDILDQQGGFGLLGSVHLLDANPLWRTRIIVGAAETVWAENGDNSGIYAVLERPRTGAVLVIAGCGGSGTNRAMLGGRLYQKLVTFGFEAIVVDGPVRDPDEFSAGGCAVSCVGINGRRPSKGGNFLLDVPVAIGGCPILPGDLIAVDADGTTRTSREEGWAPIDKARAARAEESASTPR